jgi:hypothetical protein
MFRFARSSSPILTRVAMGLTLVAAVACDDRTATAPQRTATQRAWRDVNPSCPLQGLTFYPLNVQYPGVSTGTLTLSTPAPAPDGYTFTVQVDRPDLASVDSPLRVQPGATSVTFPVRTIASPNVTTGIEVTVTYPGCGSGNGFNLLAGGSGSGGAGAISATPNPLTFAPQAIGTSSASQLVTVRNNGTATVTFSSFSTSGPFRQTTDCGATLAATFVACSVWVTYTPTAAGAQSGLLTIQSDAQNSPTVVVLNGTGFVPTPGISVTPMAIGWGGVALGNATSGRVVQIRSTGNAPLIISSLTSGGTNPGDFPIVADACTGATLSPGASCAAYVSFEPLRVGARSATIAIANNAGGPVTVSLTGTGTKSGGYIP